MPRTIVSNSHFGKRPTAREMTTFVSHVGNQRVNYCWWNFLLSWVPGHLQGWFLVLYYCHVYETSNHGYTISRGWAFCEFADFVYVQAFCVHRMRAFGVAMRSVPTESSLLKSKGSRGKARRVQTRGDEGSGVWWTAGYLRPPYNYGLFNNFLNE